MKPILLILLILIRTELICLGQAIEHKEFKEVNLPNFLVDNQLSPEILKVEYTGGLSSGKLKDTNSKELYHLNHNTLTVSGYPLTLINKRQQQLYVGFGYTKDKYNSFDNNDIPPLLQHTFHAVNLNIFLNTRIKDKFYWFSYLQGGLQGSNPFSEVACSHNEILLNKINYKASRNMNIGLGITYVSNLGKPLILPALTFVLSKPNYLINIDFPVKAEIEGIFSRGKWRPVAGLLFPASTMYVRKTNEYFSISGLTGYVGTRYRLLDILYLHAAWQTGLGETFKAGNRSHRNEIGTFNGQSRFVVSLSFQVARFIPLTKVAGIAHKQ